MNVWKTHQEAYELCATRDHDSSPVVITIRNGDYGIAFTLDPLKATQLALFLSGVTAVKKGDLPGVTIVAGGAEVAVKPITDTEPGLRERADTIPPPWEDGESDPNKSWPH